MRHSRGCPLDDIPGDADFPGLNRNSDSLRGKTGLQKPAARGFHERLDLGALVAGPGTDLSST